VMVQLAAMGCCNAIFHRFNRCLGLVRHCEEALKRASTHMLQTWACWCAV
jgi:hypothetical protein